MKWGRSLVLGGLSLLVLASGVGVVYVKYLSRKHFVELQALRGERDRIDIQWGRLQLEEAALTSHARMEIQAHKRLSMRLPAPENVVVLQEQDVLGESN